MTDFEQLLNKSKELIFKFKESRSIQKYISQQYDKSRNDIDKFKKLLKRIKKNYSKEIDSQIFENFKKDTTKDNQVRMNKFNQLYNKIENNLKDNVAKKYKDVLDNKRKIIKKINDFYVKHFNNIGKEKLNKILNVPIDEIIQGKIDLITKEKKILRDLITDLNEIKKKQNFEDKVHECRLKDELHALLYNDILKN